MARRAITVAAAVLAVFVIAVTALAVAASRSAAQPVVLGPVIESSPAAPRAAATDQPPAPGAVRTATDPLQAWAQQQAQRTAIPVAAVRAYGRAELRLRAEQPGCRLGWVTLAGIGEVESDHGRYQGRTLGDQGISSTPIVGVALDGVGVARIGDTDGGMLDGDPALDRAVGPMQMLPSTWRRWAADGDGDGVREPQDIDDAALAAARYLCASGSLRSDEGWRAAVLSYNASSAYLVNVAAWAGAYAGASSRR